MMQSTRNSFPKHRNSSHNSTQKTTQLDFPGGPVVQTPRFSFFTVTSKYTQYRKGSSINQICIKSTSSHLPQHHVSSSTCETQMLSVALPSPLSLCPVCCLVTLAGQNYTQISWLLPPCPLSPFKGRTTQGSLSRRTVVFRNKDNLILYSHHISQVWSLGSNLFSFMKVSCIALVAFSPHS